MTYDETPIISDGEGLFQYGKNIARSLEFSGSIRGRAISAQIKGSLSRLNAKKCELEKLFCGSETTPPEAEWLLDNYYLAQREGLSAICDYTGSIKLPQSRGTAALLLLCRELLRCGEGEFSISRCKTFFGGCQQVYVLSGAELSCLIPTLKAAAVMELNLLYSKGGPYMAKTAGGLFCALRELTSPLVSDLVNEIDLTNKILHQDPAKIYESMDEKTRYRYKLQVTKLSRNFHLSESRVAEKALMLAKNGEGLKSHVGYWLFNKPLGRPKNKKSGVLYVATLLLLSLSASVLAGLLANNVWTGILTFLPAFEIFKTLVDWLILRVVTPAHIPCMELSEGIPSVGRTLCVISALLTGPKKGAILARRLEEYRLSNRDCGENLIFGILADLPDCNTINAEKDLEFINAAKKEIQSLNVKYGGGFFLFTRERNFSPRDHRFSARERKRGAITELARMLSGKGSELQCLAGTSLSLRGVRYILTLDEDTRLAPGSARKLVGAMLHPLNTPVIDEKRQVVTEGHGIIHPRMTTELHSCGKSGFSLLFAPPGGIDPYGGDASELYMDVYGNGSFAGKGIIDIDAFLSCASERFPQGRILSHDALEGAYLHGGYMGDLELLDSFPSDVLAYYRRMHRWTRGDWQNAPYVFLGGRELSFLDRFRLLDSIRRSLMPPSIFIAMAAAFLFPGKGLWIAGLSALSACVLALLFSLLREIFRSKKKTCAHCHSMVFRGVSRCLMQTMITLLILPYEAYIRFTAAFSSLWRMLISHRRLLDWTPASVFDGYKNGPVKFWGRMLISPILGIALFLFSPSVIGKTAGLIWILAPGAAWAISLENKKASPVSEEDRSFLLLKAREMWGFFHDLCVPEDHFLPPDNIQERPPVGVAHRTSPTNIGLCLLSCISVMDMGVAGRHEALGLVENILSTMERMPKWEGHLYNWYDTRTLTPLHPSYVSTVDSGNLVACLLILRQGLLEYGESSLANRCEELMSHMAFAPLYDYNRHLFTIGINTEAGSSSENFYDLMASEARTTGFIAIARGEIPLRHWRSLSRAQVESYGYRGMVSWTGSMFEYLMPRLFFTHTQGSSMYETLNFCVGAQKVRTKKLKLPWGVSESAYYALDPGLSYRYKAHGCAALALKRDMDSELVVSPYSSFLALSCGVRSAVENLKRLEKMGASAKYGFYDALDFTQSRTCGKEAEVVRCVMAHHLGMSIISCANALCEDLMCKRLMREPEMAGHACLLDERLPLEGVLLKRKEPKAPEKPPRDSRVYWEKRGSLVDHSAPVCCLLSNGSYSIILTDSGTAIPFMGELSPYYTPRGICPFSHGVDLYLMRGEKLHPLLPDFPTAKGTSCHWEFSFSGAKLTTVSEDIRAQMTLSVSASVNGEKRVISVDSPSSAQEDCKLLVTLQPLLAKYDHYINHPAFYRLGIHTSEREGSIIIKRLRRGNTVERYLCISASEPIEFSSRRELVPGRSGIFEAAKAGIPSAHGWQYDPFICALLPLRLSSDTLSAVTLAIAVSDTEDGAYNGAQRILASGTSDVADYPDSCATGLHLNDRQAEEAMELLCTLTYPDHVSGHDSFPRNSLWPFGISGDLPIKVMQMESEDELELAESLMKQHVFLSTLSIPFDLVFITDEGGDYMQPMTSELSRLRATAGGDSPHIRIIDKSVGVEPILALEAQTRSRASEQTFCDVISTSSEAPLQSYPNYNWNSDNSFTFYINHSLPPRSWSNMLTNGHFGALATDCGTGHMWFKNAREYQITPWLCDSLATCGPETLTQNGISLFASPEDTSCSVTFGFGWARWKKTVNSVNITTSAFVPSDTDAKVFIIQWEGQDSLSFRWSAELLLGSDQRTAGSAVIEHTDELFFAKSPESPFSDSFLVGTSGEVRGFTSDKILWAQGKTDESLEKGGFLGIEIEATSPLVLVCGCDSENRIKEMCNLRNAADSLKSTLNGWNWAVSGLELHSTVPGLDRLMNGWALYQTIACRILGRCSISQSGGAIGFRDQLQDSVNIILIDSMYAKNQILESCRHQYQEGDVMHWWHILPEYDAGVRTRCSDDLLWLPWALCEYTEKTGDYELCSVMADWLSSKPLADDERDRYEKTVFAEEPSDVLSHAAAALDMVMARGSGSHGLLLMGSGDWNDGMNQVGSGGQGESEWLSWFFSHTAKRFGALLRRLGCIEEAKNYENAAAEVGSAADKAWDRDHYLRGFFDDGSPLGGWGSKGCEIDSIAQSFACLCPEADSMKTNRALTTAVSALFDREHRFIRLFYPPFEDNSPYPGYIESYGPGFRENGGQYTHGALWLVMALFRRNRPDEAMELLSALLPSDAPGKTYEAEPYVLSADVYGNPDCLGKAGWSWYTGSSGWFFRIVTEELLGLRLREGVLHVEPKIPQDFSCTLKFREKDGTIRDLKLGFEDTGETKS